MDKEKLLYSHSEPLRVSELRGLKVLAKDLDKLLNKTEFLKIMSAYNECLHRLLKENGEEV